MTHKVVVIGGGLSGLASAVWLSESGWDVTVLERRSTLGGAPTPCTSRRSTMSPTTVSTSCRVLL